MSKKSDARNLADQIRAKALVAAIESSIKAEGRTFGQDQIDDEIALVWPDQEATSWVRVAVEDDDGLEGWTRLSKPVVVAAIIEVPAETSDQLILPTSAPANPILRTLNGRVSCGCGCGRFPSGKRSRFVPGHDARVPHTKFGSRDPIVRVS